MKFVFFTFLSLVVFNSFAVEVPKCYLNDEDYLVYFNNRFDLDGNDKIFHDWVLKNEDKIRLPFYLLSHYYSTNGDFTTFVLSAKNSAYSCDSRVSCSMRSVGYIKMVIENILERGANVKVECDSFLTPLPVLSVGND